MSLDFTNEEYLPMRKERELGMTVEDYAITARLFRPHDSVQKDRMTELRDARRASARASYSPGGHVRAATSRVNELRDASKYIVPSWQDPNNFTLIY